MFRSYLHLNSLFVHSDVGTQFFRPSLSYLFEANKQLLSEQSIKEEETNITRKLAVVVPEPVIDDDAFSGQFISAAVPRRIALNVATVNVAKGPVSDIPQHLFAHVPMSPSPHT